MKTRIRQNHSGKQNDPIKTNQGVTPTLEEIRRRAEKICASRGGAPGRELDDWLQAEQELNQQSAASNAGATQ